MQEIANATPTSTPSGEPATQCTICINVATHSLKGYPFCLVHFHYALNLLEVIVSCERCGNKMEEKYPTIEGGKFLLRCEECTGDYDVVQMANGGNHIDVTSTATLLDSEVPTKCSLCHHVATHEFEGYPLCATHYQYSVNIFQNISFCELCETVHPEEKYFSIENEEIMILCGECAEIKNIQKQVNQYSQPEKEFFLNWEPTVPIEEIDGSFESEVYQWAINSGYTPEQADALDNDFAAVLISTDTENNYSVYGIRESKYWLNDNLACIWRFETE